MIGFRERERTRERRLSWARVAIFFLWVILVFSLISLFFSINNERRTRTRTSHSIPPKRRSFSRALFHTPSRRTTTTTTKKTKLVVSSKNGDDRDPHHTTNLYGDEKRIIHTGPNPLHNKVAASAQRCCYAIDSVSVTQFCADFHTFKGRFEDLISEKDQHVFPSSMLLKFPSVFDLNAPSFLKQDACLNVPTRFLKKYITGLPSFDQ
ncbi:hypothetical protein HKD37_07G020089 [Glycine soja]